MTSSPDPITEHTLVRWAEALAGIARTGLGFTQIEYERERYREVLAIAADIRQHATRGYDPERQFGDWMADVGEHTAGYVTPKIAVGAVVGNDAGELLLVQRSDSGIWLYPTGWADIGYSAAEVAVKEVSEETGIQCEPLRLITVIDGLRAGFSHIPLYSLVFYCRATGGELRGHPLETMDVGWFSRNALPVPLAANGAWAARAFAAIDGLEGPTSFDPVRSSIWPEVPPDPS